MNETKHTPGPWMVDEPHQIWAESIGEYVAITQFEGVKTVSRKQSEANARLIAAAPDLLEFAEKVRRTGDTRLASMAIALIAKAAGETK